jgi:hypothetical protein
MCEDYFQSYVVLSIVSLDPEIIAASREHHNHPLRQMDYPDYVPRRSKTNHLLIGTYIFCLSPKLYFSDGSGCDTMNTYCVLFVTGYKPNEALMTLVLHLKLKVSSYSPHT